MYFTRFYLQVSVWNISEYYKKAADGRNYAHKVNTANLNDLIISFFLVHSTDL